MNTYKAQLLQNLYNAFSDFQSSSVYIPGATQLVKGDGDPASPIMFVGEAPGAEEDKQGKPFVGRSGKLLTQVLQSFGINRSDVFITNIVKCRPPNNRVPNIQEVQMGKNLILNHEIAIIQPRVIVTLGLSALQGLLEIPCTMGTYRGKNIFYFNSCIYPTYHPAYILRNPSAIDLFKLDIRHALVAAQLIN